MVLQQLRLKNSSTNLWDVGEVLYLVVAVYAL
jgi:hypothetical protein